MKSDDYDYHDGLSILEMTVDGVNFTLIQTCSACPEQYDVFVDSKQVAYFRLRHGKFTVACPDVGSEVVYSANPSGDGCFRDNERTDYLTNGLHAVVNWMNAQRKMTNLSKLFSKHHDDEYLKFDRVDNKMSARMDVHALMLLDKLVPDGGCMILTAQHSMINLDVDAERLARVATEKDIIELIRCGVSYDFADECLNMEV